MAETALITGASSGIGEQFARQLSDRGCELILVARREDRLENLAEELPTEAHVIACDLGRNAADLLGKVAKLGVDVDLLVNNAGFGARDRFLEIPAGRQAEMVRVNCEAVVLLTHALLGPMVERGRGGVITVASTAGMQPLPYEATYAATKAFALNLTEALNAELRGTGVKVLAVNPGPVPTEWQQVAGYEESGAEMMPGQIEADQVVREALRAYDRGKRSMIPGRFFRNFMRINSPAPRAIQLRVSERMYRPKN
ncbi:MAG: SDR family NAD(P)-dependent oxidoreductase [Solirubrobacterales bacterium]